MLSTSLTGYRGSPPRPVVSHHRIHERRRVASPKERTAHHEAGHVCWNVFYWGRPIYSVSILPDELTKGLVRLTPESRPMPSGHIPECVVGNRDRARVVAEYYMAGLAAEANLRGTRAMWLAAEFETARAIIDTTWPRVEVGSVLRDCWIGACKFLAVPPIWAGVTALADALLQHGELDGDRARQIVLDAARATPHEHSKHMRSAKR